MVQQDSRIATGVDRDRLHGHVRILWAAARTLSASVGETGGLAAMTADTRARLALLLPAACPLHACSTLLRPWMLLFAAVSVLAAFMAEPLQSPLIAPFGGWLCTAASQEATAAF